MPEIRPITALRNTNEISNLCHEKKEPVFITKNGYGDLVIMSVETYEKLLYEKDIDKAIEQADAEYQEDGKALDAQEALKLLQKKFLK